MISVNIIIDNPEWKKKKFKIINYLKKNIKHLSKKPILKKKHSFSILLTDNKNMKSLNKKFRKKNKSTDVLSFPLNNKNILDNNYLGDIAISFEFVSKRSIKTDFKYELDRMWVHGYLHLLGYNHIVYKDYKKMHLNELKILKYFEHKLYTQKT